MKYLICFLLVFVSYNSIAQTAVGIKGGTNFTFFNENQEQFEEQVRTEVGYFAGLFVDVPLGEAFHLQPELLYKGLGEFRFINAPIYVRYDVGANFALLAGPSLNYFFDFFSNNFKVRADISTLYQLSETLDINLKFTLGLEEVSPNVLFIGLGYRL